MGKKDDRHRNETNPKKAEKAGAVKGVKDAFCTECGEWYDSSNSGQVNRHAH